MPLKKIISYFMEWQAGMVISLVEVNYSDVVYTIPEVLSSPDLFSKETFPSTPIMGTWNEMPALKVHSLESVVDQNSSDVLDAETSKMSR